MNKTISNRKIGILLLLLGGLLMHTGCNRNPGTETLTEYSSSTQILPTTQQAEEEKNPKSIAYKEWNVEENLVEGKDNLYELNVPELMETGIWIVSTQGYHEYLLVLAETQSMKYNLYMVNPLEEKVIATYTLPDGYYVIGRAFYVNDADEIIIGNMDAGEIYILNEKLEEKEIIYVEGTDGETLFLTEDQQYVYYVDYHDNRFYQYNVECASKVEVLSGVNLPQDSYCTIQGLINEDTCMVFSYYVEGEEPTDCYEVRNIATGESIYKGNGEITDIEEIDNQYVMKHFSDGMNEIVFGKMNHSKASVLSLKEYKEYETYDVDLDTMSVISGQLNTFEKKVIYHFYDMKTGLLEKTLELTDLDDMEGIWLGTANYLQDADSCVVFLNGEVLQWYVWDLTKESSNSGDGKSYVYDWQNPECPDTEALSTLEQRAEQMSERFGVTILIGDKLQDCMNDEYDFVVSNNVIRIEKMLDLLEKALSKYPEGMLAQLDNPERWSSRLEIYLAGGITPVGEDSINSVGIHHVYAGQNYIVLDINSISDLENTIYHEVFHAIEEYVNWGNGFYSDSVWDELNPAGFSYDYDYVENQDNVDSTYTVADAGENAYFVDLYAKSFPHEDRARIMEFAMLDAGDTRRENIASEPIQNKLRYICRLIRQEFDTTGWPEQTVWEEACNYNSEELSD